MDSIYELIVKNVTNGKIDKQLAVNLIKMLKETEHVSGNGSGDVAIIGIALKLPRADDALGFWELLKNGTDCIGELPETRREDLRKYLKFKNIPCEGIRFLDGAFLNEIDKFDYKFFHLTPKEASLMDPCQRLFLENVWQLFEDAGYSGENITGSNTGVYLGYSTNLRDNYAKLVSDVEPESVSASVAGNIAAITPSRISYILDLKGPTIVVDTACSSSLTAVHLACKGLQNGDCDMAIAAGIKLCVLPVDDGFKIGIESSNARANAFDDSADGTGIGEGVASVLLKPLKNAIKDRDSIYAVIKGSAVNQDGTSIGLTAPNPAAQTEVIIKALKAAGVEPDTISYLEAHGTGTSLGDPIEIQGIQNAFRKYSDKKQFCAVGTVKTNIGHLYEASGIAGLIKAVLALKYKQIPPSLNFRKPNKKIDFLNSPVYVNDKLSDWNPEGGIRRCGVSSFGFSGNNCHVILEEAPWNGKEDASYKEGYMLFTLSARSEYSLELLVEAYKGYLAGNHTYSIDDICYTANTGRKHHNHRIAIIAKDKDDLLEKLNRLDYSTHEENGVFYNTFNIVKKTAGENRLHEVLESDIRKATGAANEIVYQFVNAEKKDTDALHEICKLYTAGANIKWKEFYRGEKGYKVNLPLYPFEKSRCWLEIPETDGQNRGLENNLYYEVGWRTEPRSKEECLPAGELLVIKGGAGTGDEVTKKLQKNGLEAIEVEVGTGYEKVNDNMYKIGTGFDDCERLVGELKKRSPGKIIYFGGMDSEQGIDGIEKLKKSQERGIKNLYWLMKAVMKHIADREIELIIITKFACEVDRGEEAINPINAGLLGLGRVLGRENPNIKVRAIDIDSKTSSDDIISELSIQKQTYVTAYRSGKRYVEEFRAVEIEKIPYTPVEIKSEGIYVITGGMGGIGLEVARLLAGHGKVNLALINRSGLPEKEAWDQILNTGKDKAVCRRIQAIRDLEAKGANVECFSSYMASLDEVQTIFEILRKRYGRINGVVHGAGVAENELIIDQSEETVEEILKPKIYGTWILDRLTEKDNPDFFVMFSSVATVFSAPKQACYAAANAFLDAYSCEMRRVGRKAATINWVAWKETGMAAENGLAMDTMFKTLPTADGIGAFEELLNRDIGRVLVGKINYESKMALLFEKSQLRISDEIRAGIAGINGSGKSGKPAVKPEITLRGKDRQEYTRTEEIIAGIYREVTGLNEFNIDDDFFELGGDSILLLRVQKKLEEYYPGKVSISDLFEHSSIAKLSKFISSDEACQKAALVQESEKQADRNTKTVISRVEEAECYPCSSAQKRLFVLNQMEDSNTLYNISHVLIINGKLDTKVFEDFIKNLIQRHEALRTSFQLTNGEPVQIIHEELDFKIQYLDMPDGDLNNIVAGFIKPFDITSLPLWRMAIVQLDKGRQALLFDMHHIITDGISMNIFTQEFKKFYSGETLPVQKLRYRDFAAWQQNFNQSEQIKKQEAYWLKVLEGELPVLKMQTDYRRPAKQSNEGDQVVMEIDKETTEEIKRLASEAGSTLYMALLAVYTIVLSKYTGQEDIVVGTAVAGRHHPDLLDIMGMFVNMLALRNYPRRDMSFFEYLSSVRLNVLQAFENQDYPFEELVNKLNLKRDAGRNPVFDTVFSLQNTGSKDINVDGLSFEEYIFRHTTSKFDFNLEAMEVEGGIRLSLEYCTALFEGKTMEKLLGHYLKVIRQVCSDRTIMIKDIDIMDETEKEKILTKLEQDKKALSFELDF